MDYYFQLLKKAKEEYEKSKIEYAEVRGMLAVLRETATIEPYKSITRLYDYAIKESETRRSEDLSLLEIMIGLVSEQNRKLNELKEIVAYLVSSDKKLKEQVEGIEDWTKEYGEVMEFLNKWKKEKEQEEKEKEGWK